MNQQKSLSRQERELVRKHLRTVLSSGAFARSSRARDFLEFAVRTAMSGDPGALRERMIGAALFGRSIDYDTGSDSVVRVTATEVRRRLKQFYLESAPGKWPVRIDLPSGSYVPLFTFADSASGRGLGTSEPVQPGELQADAQDQQTEAPVRSSEPVVEEAALRVLPEAATAAEPSSAPTETALARRTHRLFIWVAAALLGAALISAGIFKYWTGTKHGDQQIHSLVVLPLKNLSDNPNQAFVADGLTAELINNLGQSSVLRVISLTSSMNLKGSKKMIPEITRELKVEGVLEGSVQSVGDRVRVDIQLIDGRRDRPIWAQTYLRDANSVVNLQGEIAADVLRRLKNTSSPQSPGQGAQTHSVNAEARAAYLHGLLLLQAEHDRGALTYLQQAVQDDPKFAQAHAALAECHGRMAVSGLTPNREAFAEQKSEALQAISLDPSLAEAHAELADAAMALDWDWQTAGDEYKRALALNPNSAAIHQKYAIYLIFQGLTAEAIRQAELGADLDPISAVAIRNEAFVYFFARKYDKVLSLIETTRSLGVDPPGWSFFLGGVYAQKGQYQQSIDWFLKGSKSPHTLGHLGNVYALSGQRSAALKVLGELQGDVRNQGIGVYEVALVYAGLGDKTSAMQWLKRASDAHDVGLLYIKVDPFLDSLRSEPDFQSLIRQVGLAP